MENLLIIIMALIAGFATFLGILLGKKYNRTWGQAFGVSFAGAMMLMISLFELIPEGTKTIGLKDGLPYVLLGGLLIFTINFYVPHLHVIKKEKNLDYKALIKASYLVLIGLIIHDFPEGFAMANSFKIADNLGVMVFLSVFIHHIPEGYALSIAASILNNSVFYYKSALYSTLSLILGSIFAIVLLGKYPHLDNYLILITAGVMSFISIHELYPLARKSNNNRLAVYGTVCAVLVFLMLDIITKV